MRRLAAIATLAVLSPFTAEFLLGDQYLAGPPELGRQLGMFAMFVAFYGAAALLIREVTRRLGRGWPTMITLSLAFAVFEEGLLTQTLFNPHYLGQDLLSFGYVPALGIGAPWTVYVLALHVVWSMGTPIAIAEALFGREPWLKKVGLSLWSISFVLGSAATFAISLFIGEPHFIAQPAQLGTTALLVVALVVLALRGFRQQPWTSTPGNPWFAFAFGLGATIAFQTFLRASEFFGSAWLVTGLMLALPGISTYVVLRMRAPAFPLAAGALLTYCGLGLQMAAKQGGAAAAEQVILILVAVGLLVVAGRQKPVFVTV